ncbi:peptide chain release factor N(5)-glutamine methyltransferase, partial [Gammaproteobacteria bacterium]|nr:peptide chain release factor N(5)-glutamine methyltransferase [Gammaproteobacteria bacterium]
GISLADLYSSEDIKLNKDQSANLDNFFKQKLKKIPLDYILKESSFFGRNFYIDERVLIPRCETELIIQYFKENKILGKKNILDAGTGSGCIAISIAYLDDNYTLYASDKSSSALEVAAINIERHKLNNIFLTQMHWLCGFQKDAFDIVISNPPYIEEYDAHLKDLSHEPIEALVSSDNGLGDIKEICSNAFEVLKYEGMLVLEHGYNQSEEVLRILQTTGLKFKETIKDHQGHHRITIATK